MNVATPDREVVEFVLARVRPNINTESPEGRAILADIAHQAIDAHHQNRRLYEDVMM